jgi:hypothetical protein
MLDPMDLVGETDAMKWAECFVEKAAEKPEIATDKNVMVAWFANAIMAGYDQAKSEDRDRPGIEAVIKELAEMETSTVVPDEKHY